MKCTPSNIGWSQESRKKLRVWAQTGTRRTACPGHSLRVIWFRLTLSNINEIKVVTVENIQTLLASCCGTAV